MANILIADDSIIMRKNLKSIITKAGHTVSAEAVNGQQAYLLYNQQETDLVTLDITMPVMDGIEALKKILEKDPKAKVIIISALDQKRMVFQALECGAKYYIIKPVTEEKVINAIDKVLGMDSSQDSEITSPSASSSISAVPMRKETSPKEVEQPQPPFTIDNKNGIFVININENIDLTGINTLNSAVQGFLFIKPLKIMLNFNSEADFKPEVSEVLHSITKRIKTAGGDLQVNGSDKIY